MHLDKDILHKGNKVYAPENCLIVPQRINMLFSHKPNKYGLPNGVKPTSSGKFEAKYNKQYLGIFNTLEEAEMAHKESKRKAIKEVAEDYKPYIPDKVYKALLAW